MGGKSSTSQQSTTQPWAQAQPALNGILNQLSPLISNSGLTPTSQGAISQLESNASAGNPYAPQISNFVQNLLNGGGVNAQSGNIQTGLSTLQNQLTPYANGSMVGNNPALQSQLATMSSDITNQINGQFAAAGRDLSPGNSQALSRGLTQGLAPTLANQYNQDVANQLNAANTLYDAQNTTSGLLSGLTQQGLANQLQGVTSANDALSAQNYAPTQLLNLEQLKQQIPAQNLGLLAQIGVPIAGLGSQSQGTATNQMSGAQQFGTIASGLGNIGKFLWG